MIKQVSPVAYQLDLPRAWTIHDVFHASLLTPYRETDAHGLNFTRPPPELIGGEEEYEVESISAHRYFGRKKQLQYLIRWKGYSSADDTWEPQSQVHAPDAIQAYHRRNPLGAPETHKRGYEQEEESPSVPLFNTGTGTDISTNLLLRPTTLFGPRHCCPRTVHH